MRLALILTGIFCAVCLLYFGVPLLHSGVLRRVLARKAASQRALVLSFDDGPGRELTGAILDLLREYDAKATFFLLGRNIAGREMIIRRIAEQGHEIGSHGYGHRHYWKVGPVGALRDIDRGQSAIRAVLDDRRLVPFRPPYGKLNLFCLLHLLMHKIPIAYWTFDLGDTYVAQTDPAGQVERLAGKAGAVVLAHDFDRRRKGGNAQVLHAVRSALQLARERNMQVMTLSELLGYACR